MEAIGHASITSVYNACSSCVRVPIDALKRCACINRVGKTPKAYKESEAGVWRRTFHRVPDQSLTSLVIGSWDDDVTCDTWLLLYLQRCFPIRASLKVRQCRSFDKLYDWLIRPIFVAPTNHRILFNHLMEPHSIGYLASYYEAYIMQRLVFRGEGGGGRREGETLHCVSPWIAFFLCGHGQ